MGPLLRTLFHQHWVFNISKMAILTVQRTNLISQLWAKQTRKGLSTGRLGCEKRKILNKSCGNFCFHYFQRQGDRRPTTHSAPTAGGMDADPAGPKRRPLAASPGTALPTHSPTSSAGPRAGAPHPLWRAGRASRGDTACSSFCKPSGRPLGRFSRAGKGKGAGTGPRGSRAIRNRVSASARRCRASAM